MSLLLLVCSITSSCLAILPSCWESESISRGSRIQQTTISEVGKTSLVGRGLQHICHDAQLINLYRIPSKAYAQDWVYAVGNFTIPWLPSPPHMSRFLFSAGSTQRALMNIWKKRFNRSVRVFGSLSFTLFHLFPYGGCHVAHRTRTRRGDPTDSNPSCTPDGCPQHRLFGS